MIRTKSSCPGRRGARASLAPLLALAVWPVVGAAQESATGAAAEIADEATPAQDSVQLGVIDVTASAETGTSAVIGIVPSVTGTATKTDTPILETPQAVSVVGAEQITMTGATSLGESLGYSAGVTTFGTGDATGDSLQTRGFRLDPYYGNVLRDGMRYGLNIFDGQQEPYGLERVELLRGPSSILYGASGPAGILNTVSKRPVFEPLRELNVSLGSFDWREISGDFGGPLDDEGKLAWRLTFLGRDANSFIDYVPMDRIYVAPALTWRPNDTTSVTVLASYQRDKTAYVYGLPYEGTVLPNPNGEIARERFVGEPGYDEFDAEQYALGYVFDHDFENGLTFRTAARYYESTQNMPLVWTDGWTDETMRVIDRGSQDRNNSSSGVTSDTSLRYDWRAGGIGHVTLGGFDISSGSVQDWRYNRSLTPLDLFNPDYGSAVFGPPVPAAFSSKDEQQRYGLYLQDQMRIGERVVVTVGGRQDWVVYNSTPTFGGQKTADDERTDAFTGRIGAVYLAPNGLAPYASFSQSFEPTAGFDRTGARFKPTTGEQAEVGLRYQPAGGDMLLSAALYQINQKNVLVGDPTDPTFSVQNGEVRSRGVELEMQAHITENANLIAAYAYTDARTIKSSPLTPENEGKRTTGIPYNQASIWGDYTFGRLGLPGLTAGFGLRFIGETLGERAELPAYAVADAMASYQFEDWTLRVNATNLTDKSYVRSCVYACFWGEPRRVIVTASYNW